MNLFEKLLVGRLFFFLIAGLIVGQTLREFGFSADAMPTLALSAILAAVGWFVPQIIHELAEINDQLSGRSKELHSFLREIK